MTIPDSEIIGKKFGRLTVIERNLSPDKKRRAFLCRCDCKAEKTVFLSNLLSGNTSSCGCLKSETDSQRTKTHGLSHKIPEYNAWMGMKNRCYNKSEAAWYRYGGRGIKVCDRWKDSFESFLADMGSKPSKKHSLDRKDNDGNYEPDNCRWATREEQMRNMSRNHVIEFNGKKQCAMAWELELGINRGTIANRKHWGWSDEEIMTTPTGGRRNPKQPTYGREDCKYCGKEHERKAVRQKFCSRACASAWRRKEGVDNEKRECVICGNDYIINKNLDNLCCSKSCGSTLGYRNRSLKLRT